MPPSPPPYRGPGSKVRREPRLSMGTTMIEVSRFGHTVTGTDRSSQPRSYPSSFVIATFFDTTLGHGIFSYDLSFLKTNVVGWYTRDSSSEEDSG